MRLEFDGEQALLQATARHFATRELEPFLARHADEPLPRDSVFELLRMVKPFGMLSCHTVTSCEVIKGVLAAISEHPPNREARFPRIGDAVLASASIWNGDPRRAPLLTFSF